MADVNNHRLLSMAEARFRLCVIWFSGSGLIFLILLATSIGNVFQGQLQQVWSASLPTVLPTLSLILSVLGASAVVERRANDNETDEHEPETFVRRDFYRFTSALSIVYLLLILVSFFAHPFVTAANAPAVTAEEVLRELTANNADDASKEEGPSAADVILLSNLWLSPIQGLVVGAMGVLFFTKRN